MNVVNFNNIDIKTKKLIKKINKCEFLKIYKNAHSRAVKISLGAVIVNGIGVVALICLFGVLSLPLNIFAAALLPLLISAFIMVAVGAWPVLVNSVNKNYYPDKIAALKVELEQSLQNSTNSEASYQKDLITKQQPINLSESDKSSIKVKEQVLKTLKERKLSSNEPVYKNDNEIDERE